MEHSRDDFKGFYIGILNEIGKHYYNPLYHYLVANPNLINTFPALLLVHEQIVMYLGRTHIAIEYYGKETTNSLPKDKKAQLTFYDYTNSDNNFFEDVIGFNYDSTIPGFRLPLPSFSEDLLFPTNKGMDKLLELKWNFDAQNSIIGINSPPFEVPQNEFCRIVNGRFFDVDDKGGLRTRHIKWMDFLPLRVTSETEVDHAFAINITPLKNLIEFDANYIYPLPEKSDYKYHKLPKVNRFIELIGSSELIETDITSFLEEDENRFILTMGLSKVSVFPQLKCEWQSEERDAIKPDFFVTNANGYTDIVEFKLPTTKGKTSVGKTNRETFSAELHSYIAQTRVYRSFFEDPKNRKWMESSYGLKIRYPKRILIVGRRWDFSNSDWKEIIEEFDDLDIMSYDDLVDTVVTQFYM